MIRSDPLTDPFQLRSPQVKLLHRAMGEKKEKQLRRKEANDVIVESEELTVSSASDSFKPDPLSEFAIVFAALIHDVGHEGVPNFVLAKQNPTLDAAYKGKSIAEQNSVDVAWKVRTQACVPKLSAQILLFSHLSLLLYFRFSWTRNSVTFAMPFT